MISDFPKKVDPSILEQHVDYYVKRIKKSSLNAFSEFNEEFIYEQLYKIQTKIRKDEALGPLIGKCISIKSNLAIKSNKHNAGSLLLRNNIARYDADIVKTLKDQDAIILGTTNMDEFACGATGLLSKDSPLNAIDSSLIPGGSSSGAASSLAGNLCDISVGTDTGGSTRVPSIFNNLVSLKPSYGRISRHGLIDLAPSLDTVGFMAKSVEDLELFFNSSISKSNHDNTMLRLPTYKFPQTQESFTVGIDPDFIAYSADPYVLEKFNEFVATLGKQNIKVKKVNLSHLILASSAYYPIMSKEFYSSFSSLHPFLEEDINNAGYKPRKRLFFGKHLSTEKKHRHLYNKANDLRHAILHQMQDALSQVDFILTPACPVLPIKINKIKKEKFYSLENDYFMPQANLSGMPAATINISNYENNQFKPVGIQLITNMFSEDKLFKILKVIEGGLKDA